MTTQASVVAMANQIAKNIGRGSPSDVAPATARHITEFWSPRMRALIAREAAAGATDLSPEARAAVALLPPEPPEPPEPPDNAQRP